MSACKRCTRKQLAALLRNPSRRYSAFYHPRLVRPPGVQHGDLVLRTRASSSRANGRALPSRHTHCRSTRTPMSRVRVYERASSPWQHQMEPSCCRCCKRRETARQAHWRTHPRLHYWLSSNRGRLPHPRSHTHDSHDRLPHVSLGALLLVSWTHFVCRQHLGNTSGSSHR